MAEDKPVRFGITGCPVIARKLARAILAAPNATLVAIGSRSVAKAEAFKAENGLPGGVTAYGSYMEVLDDPCVDAVYIPLPTSLHVEWCVAAARRGKHVLLEKPVAVCVEDLDLILEACEANGVQFMDGTMWMHHPRTGRMKELLSDPDLFGQPRAIHSTFTYRYLEDPDFFKNNIRVKPDLDSLGSLGDTGWYCIISALWATGFELPKTAVALRGTVTNEAAVILTCGSSLHWEDGKVATFHCSFQENMTMELSAIGTRGALRVGDYLIPYDSRTASFTFVTDSWFAETFTGWNPVPAEHVVTTDLPQEVLMVKEFSGLVSGIRDSGGKPSGKWPEISRKTLLVLEAVKTSIDKGCEPVEVGR